MTEQSSSYLDFFLDEMRLAYLRAKILENELCFVGVATKAGWLSVDEALAHLNDCGALGLVGTAITAPSTH